tara:strand:+ start:44 stop:304 length:261 start_codon:yes stop_codon:yes gene_type:complete
MSVIEHYEMQYLGKYVPEYNNKTKDNFKKYTHRKTGRIVEAEEDYYPLKRMYAFYIRDMNLPEGTKRTMASEWFNREFYLTNIKKI